MFNFFDEIKSGVKNLDVKDGYNIVNISGKICYVEGHKGLKILSNERVVLIVKNANISIEGKNLVLRELYDECIKISGNIQKIEVFDEKK